MSLAALLGCGDNQLPPEEPPPAPPAITGVTRVIHWDDAGQQTPVNNTDVDLYIEAELPGGDVRTATVADDGSFSIDGDAPTGPYWLRLVDGPRSQEDVYLLTDQTKLDLGRDVVGNAGTRARDPGTHLDINATGLATWDYADDGDLVLPDLAHVSTIVPYYATNTPAPGDTVLNAGYAWFAQQVSSTPADAYVVQVRPAHDAALSFDYFTPIKAFHSAPVAIEDGTTAQVTGTFVDPPALDVPVHWMRSAFAAQAAAMKPEGCGDQLALETYWVHALPGHGTYGGLDGVDNYLDGTVGYGPRLIQAFYTVAQTDLVGTLSVRNPYPADWLYAKYAMTYAVGCGLPDGSVPGNAEVSIGVLTSKLDDSPVTPLVGPVAGPQIGGQDLLVPQVGVGLHPTISWQAPALGSPTSYEVKLLELEITDSGYGLHEDAKLVVPGSVTTITLPRDLLQNDGTIYALEIRAISQPEQDVASAPFRSGMPLGYADLLTNYFIP
jgi:hypothetical protein